MAVTGTTYKVSAPGNGSATVFSFDPIILFEPRASGGTVHDLEVTFVAADGTETVLSEGTGTTNYSVSIATYPGAGSITYPATLGTKLATGESLVMKRRLELKQYEELDNQGGYFADTQEEMHDRHRMVDQQQQEEIDRAVKVPIGSSETPEDFFQSLLDTADAAAASAAAAQTAETNAETAETNAETAETNAEAAAAASAASAAAAAASAASGLFSTLSNKSTNFSITADTDNSTLYLVDSSGGSVTATLPSIATAGEGERYGFLRTSASNTITLSRNGSDTINGVAANYTMAAASGDLILLLADDASPDNWIVINWSQAVADESTLEKVGNTLRIKDLGVSTGKIAANAVTLAKLATQAANTFLANASNATAVPSAVSLAASQLAGRGASGDIAAIALGTNLSMSGTTLNASGGGLTELTLQATTSGTAFTFTIPSTAKRVIMVLNAVSTNALSNLVCRVGPSSGVVSSGYVGGSFSTGGTNTSTSGLQWLNNGAARTCTAFIEWVRMDASTNRWVGRLTACDTAGPEFSYGTTTIALSGNLERIALTTTGGDTFDAGSVNALYD